MNMWLLVVLGIVVLLAIVVLVKSVRIIPQARAGVVERLGRYSRTLTPRSQAARHSRMPHRFRSRWIIPANGGTMAEG